MAAETLAPLRRVPIQADSDIVTARQTGRELASELGFSQTDLTLIATAVSEIARNIVLYADKGEVVFSLVQNGSRVGILIVATDQGPGIRDVELAMQHGYSTMNSLGLGLPGARRMMDEFEISSVIGKGTNIRMVKWVQ